MTRYFSPWSYREKVYYSLMLSPDIYNAVPWYDWFQSMASLAASQFPFSFAQVGDTVVQVGCNRLNAETQGASQSLLLAQLVGPSGLVVVVESEAINCAGMEQAHNIAKMPWVKFFNYAASDTPGMVEGLDVNGHSYFYQPALGKASPDPSRLACPELRVLWDEIESTGKPVVLKSERMETLLASIDAKPTFVNLTINGFEPPAIRGLGSLLDGDIVVAFQARTQESFFATGFLEDLEERGFVLVLSNTLHSRNYRWFPYVTAMRPHRLDQMATRPIPGRFAIDEREKVLTFIGDAGERPLVTAT